MQIIRVENDVKAKDTRLFKSSRPTHSCLKMMKKQKKYLQTNDGPEGIFMYKGFI